MAKRKQVKADVVSATLPKGTVIYGTQEVVDRVVGKQKSKTSTRTPRATADDSK